MNQGISDFITNNLAGRATLASDTFFIPVVVHIITNGGAIGAYDNPTDATVISTIDYLNKVYNGSWTGAGGAITGVGNLNIQFVLATKDTAGRSTTGIERINGTTIPNYSASGASTTDYGLSVKNVARWDPFKYYNIWVVHELNNCGGSPNPCTSFTAGFAIFPYPTSYADSINRNVDGIVMLATQLTQGNKVIPHEFGHTFNLYHPFQGVSGGANGNDVCPPTGATAGDLCADTDPIDNPAYAPNTYLFSARNAAPYTAPYTNRCGGTYNDNTEANFMNYTNTCRLFTPNQRDRMIASCNTTLREGLANSWANNKKTYPTTWVAPRSAAITPVSLATINAAGISKVKLNDNSVYSLNTIGDKGYLNNAKKWYDLFVINPNATITMYVTLLSSNANQLGVWIDYNNDGSFNATNEQIYLNTNIASRGASTDTTVAITFTVPANAALASGSIVRMRIINDLITSTGASLISNNSSSLLYGQAEDYPVYLQCNPPTTTNASVCAGQATTLTATGVNTIVWYNAAGVRLSSGNTYTTPSLTTNTVYYVKDSSLTCISPSAQTSVLVTTPPTISTSGPAKLGNALNFDGNDDKATVADNTVGNFGTGAFTVEFWVNTSQQGNSNLISKRSLCNNVSMWNINLVNNKVVAELIGSTTGVGTMVLTSSQSITDGLWHHVAVTRSSAGLVTIYIDGVNTGSGNGGLATPTDVGSTANTANVTIGTSACGPINGANNFKGTMDEVRLWGKERTLSQINASRFLSALGTDTVGLKIYYDFNQGTAEGANTTTTTLTDRSRNLKNATLSTFALTGKTSNFINSGVSSLTAGTTATLTNSTTGGVWSITNLTGSATVTSAGVVTGVSVGTVRVNYTVTTGPCVVVNSSILNIIPAAPIAGASFSRCGGGVVSFSATVAANCTIDWYATATGGSVLAGGTGVTTLSISVPGTTTYYAQSRTIADGSVSTTRTPVTVVCNGVPIGPVFFWYPGLNPVEYYCGHLNNDNAYDFGVANQNDDPTQYPNNFNRLLIYNSNNPNTPVLNLFLQGFQDAPYLLSNNNDVNAWKNFHTSFNQTTTVLYQIADAVTGCTSGILSHTFVISPLPVTTTTASPYVCSGTTSVPITVQSSGGYIGSTQSGFYTGSASPNVAIPESTQGVSSIINISGYGSINANTPIDVYMNFSHTNNSDLHAYLVGPNNCGTLELIHRNGGNADGMNVTFHTTGSFPNISSTNTLTSGLVTGNYMSLGGVSTLPLTSGGLAAGSFQYNVVPIVSLTGGSCPVNGDWKLFIADLYQVNTGTLNSWSLKISNDARIDTVPVAIPDNSNTGVSKSFTISGISGNISANTPIDVKLNFSHTYDSDINAFLVGPNNCGALELSTGNGGNYDGMNLTLHTIGSFSNITSTNSTGSGLITGDYLTEMGVTTAPVASSIPTTTVPLVSLTGGVCPINGVWKLFIADLATSDVGNLISAAISIRGSYSNTFSGTGTFGPVTYSGIDNATGTTNVTNFIPSSPIYATTTDSHGCVSAQVSTSILVELVSPAVTSSGISFCGSGSTTVQGAVTTGNTIDWYSAATGGTLLASGTTSYTTPVISSTTTYYAQSRRISSGCLATTRTPVTVTINPLPPISGVISNSSPICGSGTQTINATIVTTGNTVDWYAVPTGGTPLATGTVSFTCPVISTSTNYYAESRNITTGCVSSTRSIGFILVETLPLAPSVTTPPAICGSGSAVITATSPSNTTVYWYSTSTGGSALNLGSPFTTPVISTTATYYASSVSRNACVSATRTPVIVTVNSTSTPVPATPASITQTLVDNTCGNRVYRYTAAVTTSADGYVWIVPATVGGASGFVVDSGNINSSRIIKVRFSSNVAALTTDSIFVNAKNCGGSSANRSAKLSIVALSLSTPTITTTALSTTVCGAKQYRYAAPALPLASTTSIAGTGYVWAFTGTLGANAFIDSGNVNSQVIRVTYTNNAAAAVGDSVKVYYTSACGNSIEKASKLTNTLLTAPAAPTVTVTAITTNVCGAKVYRYSASALPAATTTALAATGWSWSLPEGPTGATGSLDSGSLSSQTIRIKYTSNALAVAGDTIRVRFTSSCGLGTVKATKLTNTLLSAPAAPTVTVTAITTNICGARIYRYAASALPAATTTAGAATGWSWSLPEGPTGATGSLDSGSLSSQVIRIKYTSNAAAVAGDTIRIRFTSDCGLGTSKATKLTNAVLNPPAAPASVTITLVSNVCGARVYRYTAPALPVATTTAGAATGYAWALPVGPVGATGSLDSGVLSGAGARYIRIKYTSNLAASAGDTIRVAYTSVCGNGATKSQYLSNALLACATPPPVLTKTEVEIAAPFMNVEVYPNPSTSAFKLLVKTADKGTFKARILDVLGREIKSFTGESDQTIKFGNELKAGVYMIEVREGDKVKTVRVVKY